jgi:D-sedoheptulose 7-phosphate isomerase
VSSSPAFDSSIRDELETLLSSELTEHREVFAATSRTLAQPLSEMLNAWERGVRSGGKILLFGNGGSAADAQHIAAEFVVRYQADRRPIAAIALTTDSSTLTACGNDLGYETLFARQVDALGRHGDVAVGISTSGKSPNVLSALREARARGMHTTGLTGGDGGEMVRLCDSIVVVPSRVTARIQEMHIMIGHILCKALERRLGLV